MKGIILDQVRVVDSRFPHELRRSIEDSIWKEIGNDYSVILQYKLDYLEVLSSLIKREIKEGPNNLPAFTQHMGT